MPKRTNAFQELVTLIQEALAPEGATVTPSAMVPGPTSGALREIDVLLETAIGPYRLKIAVEAKDEGRKIDATKMETIIGKYRGRGSIAVNKVVVISRNGYTAEAMTRAKNEGFDLLTLTEARTLQWAACLPQKFNLHASPMPIGFELEPTLPKRADQARACSDGRFICLCHGYDYGSPSFFMQQFLYRHIMPSQMLIDKMHDVAANGSSGKAELTFGAPLSNHVFRLGDVEYPVTRINMMYRYVHAEGTLSSSVHELTTDAGETTRVMHSTGTVGGHDVRILMPLGVPNSRGIVKVAGPSPTSTDPNYAGPHWRLNRGKWQEMPSDGHPKHE